MKLRITSLLTALLCLLAGIGLAGCRGKDKSEVYFLNFKPESASVYEELAKLYKEETGVSVKVVTAAANNYEQTLKSEIAKTNAPTIFQVNGPIGYRSWDDYCLDIKDTDLYSFLADDSLAIKDEKGVYHVQGGGYNTALSHVEVSLNYVTDSVVVNKAETV